MSTSPVVGLLCVCVHMRVVSVSLQCLTHMSVSGNHLEVLPVEVGELGNLVELNLEGNELKRCAPHWLPSSGCCGGDGVTSRHSLPRLPGCPPLLAS